MREANWIDGDWCAAGEGDAFEAGLRMRGPEPQPRWPRSGVADLTRALEGLRREAEAWSELGHERRARVLAGLLDGWQAKAPGVDELAAGLGLFEGELDGDLESALVCGDDLIARGDAGESGGRPWLLRVDARESLAGLVREAFPALLSGRTVLLLSDPDLPWMAEEFCRALSIDEATRGILALLHDDRSTCWSAALNSDAFERAYLPGVDPERASPTAPIRFGAPATRSFGEGVTGAGSHGVEGLGPGELQITPITNSTFAVLEDDDPRSAAEQVLGLAFGRVQALSGQRAGQVGRVACHERRFSEFTAALLEGLELEQEERACRTFGHDLERYCAKLVRLGLDEGATLIWGGAAEGAGFRAPRQKGILAPSVFTNTEPTMGVTRAQRPAPVLCLMRVPSDTEVRELTAGS